MYKSVNKDLVSLPVCSFLKWTINDKLNIFSRILFNIFICNIIMFFHVKIMTI